MLKHRMTKESLEAYREHLIREEKAIGTIEKYLRDLKFFMEWLDGRDVTKEETLAWKKNLLERGLRPSTINGKLSSINGYFAYMGWADCKAKFLRNLKTLYCSQGKELTKEEYRRLLTVANQQGRERLALVIETICATGIRVSETQYITVEAARRGEAEIMLKGKVRIILLPSKLCRKLMKYAKKKGIRDGAIFRTSSGRALERRQIWAELKSLCEDAQVEPGKVFPHNLRHLFARTYHKANNDIIKLANVLGHSSIETTRIYLKSTTAEHARSLERLGLVS